MFVVHSKPAEGSFRTEFKDPNRRWSIAKLRSGNAPKKLASEGSRRPRESPADRSLCIFPSAPFPKVNLGPLPGEGRWKNPPSLNNSQSLWGVNYHLNQVYFWKPHEKTGLSVA